MEELVNKLANLQAEHKSFEDRAESAVRQMGYDRRIDDLKEALGQQIELRDSLRLPFEEEMAKIDEGIEDISNQIVYAWDPETMKKTMKFDVGVLTLRTTQSVDIGNPAILLDNLISHFSTHRVANEFISGFKKTIVRQFIGMHPQSKDVVELKPKTTVKLENVVQQTSYDTDSIKGTKFEEYVIKLFPEKWFALHDWTRDISDKVSGRRVESNGNPDLVMRYKPTDALIAVECKFRSNLYKGTINWSNPSQFNRYNKYTNDTGIPVYVVIGLGGKPYQPDQMFCIPLESAKYPKLYSSIYMEYVRNPDKKFFWDGKTLK